MSKRNLESVRGLEEIVRDSKRVDFKFVLDIGKGLMDVEFQARPAASPKHYLRVSAFARDPISKDTWMSELPDNLREPLQGLRRRYPKAKLLLEKIVCKAQGSSVKGVELRGAVTSALAEVFGAQIAGSSVARAIATDRAAGHELLDLLRKKGGVKNWNHLDVKERKRRGPYRHVGLDHLVLDRADFASLDFQRSSLRDCKLRSADLGSSNFNHADLSGADLSKASCFRTKFHSAKLEGARLVGAQLGEAVFRRANLKGANLEKAQLEGTDFSDADLSGARLTGASFGPGLKGARGTHYNNRTRFPKDFRPAKGWVLMPAK